LIAITLYSVQSKYYPLNAAFHFTLGPRHWKLHILLLFNLILPGLFYRKEGFAWLTKSTEYYSLKFVRYDDITSPRGTLPDLNYNAGAFFVPFFGLGGGGNGAVLKKTPGVPGHINCT
jgi:hypothetical protein